MIVRDTVLRPVTKGLVFTHRAPRRSVSRRRLLALLLICLGLMGLLISSGAL